MLTYNRYEPFKKSFLCFLKQTYENKQLVIVNSGDEKYQKKIDRFIKKYDEFNIVHIKVEKTSLGALRNIGLDNSDGEYVIVFDDDDIHHPERIQAQITLCLKSRVSGTILRNFTAVYRRKGHHCSMLRGLDGTLLVKKPPKEYRYPDMDQGEDTNFISTLREIGYSIAIIDEPYDMYEYNFYGNNTVSREHFKDMIELNEPLR